MTPSDITTLRRSLVSLLEGGHAFASPSRILADVPAHARGVRVDGVDRSLWELLEHMRVDQRDILDFCSAEEYSEPSAESLWPSDSAPATEALWTESVTLFLMDLDQAQRIAQDESIDLLAVVPRGSTQTWLRELMLVAEHNAYHLGQFVAIRKLLGAW